MKGLETPQNMMVDIIAGSAVTTAATDPASKGHGLHAGPMSDPHAIVYESGLKGLITAVQDVNELDREDSRPLRQKVHAFMHNDDDAPYPRASKYLSNLIMLLIAVSTILNIVETEPVRLLSLSLRTPTPSCCAACDAGSKPFHPTMLCPTRGGSAWSKRAC